MTSPVPAPPAALRRWLARIDDGLVRVEVVAGIALVLAIVVTVLTQVVMRYVFARPNPWTEELSRYAFIWLSLVGSSLATKRGAHFVLESVVQRLSPPARRMVARAVGTLVAALLLVLLVAGTLLAHEARLERSPALDLPMVWVYAALPVTMALMLLHLMVGLTVAKEGDPGWVSR